MGGATGCHVTPLVGAGAGHAGLTGQDQESDFIQGKTGSPGRDVKGVAT